MDDYGFSGKLAVTGVDRNGKRRFDPAAKERLIDACLEPGVSIARLALAHGVKASLLRNWVSLRRGKARKGQRAKAYEPSAAFIPVIGARWDPASPGGVGAIALRGGNEPEEPTRQAKLSAAMPNGVTLTLECGDAQLLSAIVAALGHCDVSTGA